MTKKIPEKKLTGNFAGAWRAMSGRIAVFAAAMIVFAGCGTTPPPEVTEASNKAKAARIAGRSRVEQVKLEAAAARVESDIYNLDKKGNKNKGAAAITAEGRKALAEIRLEIAGLEGQISETTAKAYETTTEINNRIAVDSADASLKSTTAPVRVFAESRDVMAGNTKVDDLTNQVNDLKRLMEQLLLQRATAPAGNSGTTGGAQ